MKVLISYKTVKFVIADGSHRLLIPCYIYCINRCQRMLNVSQRDPLQNCSSHCVFPIQFQFCRLFHNHREEASVLGTKLPQDPSIWFASHYVFDLVYPNQPNIFFFLPRTPRICWLAMPGSSRATHPATYIHHGQQ